MEDHLFTIRRSSVTKYPRRGLGPQIAIWAENPMKAICKLLYSFDIPVNTIEYKFVGDREILFRLPNRSFLLSSKYLWGVFVVDGEELWKVVARPYKEKIQS